MRTNIETPPAVYRFSERAFRKYEPVIRMAVEQYPTVIEVKLEHSAQTTFVGRCTDAVRSVLRNRWETNINMDKLEKCVHGLHVLPRENNAVRIGPRDYITKIIVISESEISETNPTVIRAGQTPLELRRPTDEDLTAALILANRSFFRGTPVHVYETSPEQKIYIDAMSYSDKYPNVVFDPDPHDPNHYTLL